MNSEINEIQNNRIKKIKVESLFGLFNYDIPLNDIGVTILIGVNGSGKSTIFKILHNILKAKFYNIIDVDFRSFEIHFEYGDFIKCERNERRVDLDDLSLNIVGNEQFERYDSFRRGFQNVLDQSKMLHDFSITVGSINHKLITSTINEDKNEIRYEVHEITNEIKTNLDKLVTESRFIETQRLQLNNTDVDDLRSAYYERNNRKISIERKYNISFVEDYDIPTSKSRIQEYASELSKIIKSERSNYFEESQDVEKQTLSEYLSRTNIDVEHRFFDVELGDIENDITEMDAHISKLSNLGIYNPNETSHISDSRLLYDNLEHLKKCVYEFSEDEVTTNNFNKLLDCSLKASLLKSYVENMKKKLEIFEDLEDKIEIFTTHINTLFDYKKIQVDLEKGFIFKLNNGEINRVIDPIDLSSGEQHEVILNYELIFKTENDSVILVDEPEISLHMLWQKKFIDNLLEIAKKNSLNIIVATHSPDIVDNHRNLVHVLSEI